MYAAHRHTWCAKKGKQIRTFNYNSGAKMTVNYDVLYTVYILLSPCKQFENFYIVFVLQRHCIKSWGIIVQYTKKNNFFLHQIYAYIYIIHEFLSSTKIQKQFYVMFFIIVIHICYFIMNYRIFFQMLYRRESTLETRKSLVVFIYVGFFGSRSEKMEGNRREIIFFHKILFVFFMILFLGGSYFFTNERMLDASSNN